MTIHLVNLTNPMMMKGPFREILSLSEQKVWIKIPDNHGVRKVQLLARGDSPDYQFSDGYLNFTVESIMDHEVIAIDLI
jgi:hypothetical protein